MALELAKPHIGDYLVGGEYTLRPSITPHQVEVAMAKTIPLRTMAISTSGSVKPRSSFRSRAFAP